MGSVGPLLSRVEALNRTKSYVQREQLLGLEVTEPVQKMWLFLLKREL